MKWYVKSVKHIEVSYEQNGISKTVQNYANKINKLTGKDTIKALFVQVSKEIKTISGKGFNNSSEDVIKNGNGNDFSKSMLFLDLCNVKGVPNLYYVYIQNKSKKRGYIFVKADGRITDPSIIDGWGYYNGEKNSYYGNIKNATIT